ncbi:glycoside hydrolase family 20 [Oleiharenicola lentus]|uniref:Glycoside hydrolase family 20 n=1 Tax=Oleiharenicola lentus TaxID=2508720 RepID=A0A4Q1C788_9BACT|nr:family 20 glycosylhydrolase [Oleiharenicola lentus]RXK54622.1 glycoside hydrolase family 20 [Oleiharenicola lentus]
MIRAFQWDLARQVERIDFLKKLLPRYARWGYEELYLHLEDAVHYPTLPGIGRDDAYTYEELGELVLTAAQCGIRVVPIINLLGHTQYLIKHPGLRDLNELRDERGGALASGQICPLHPRTLGVAEKLLRDMAPYCTAGKVHVGLDESFHLGQCPRCREEVARLGLGGHFAGHVNRLHKLVGGLGLQMGIWADMLYFVPEAIPQLPAGITAYDWYYYPFKRKPRVEFFNFAERDLHPALKKQGIRYYGCPMNGAFRYEPMPVFGDRLANIRSWWQRCQRVKSDGLLITSWEPYRLALETTTVVDAAAATLWLEADHDDATTMLARGLERALGSKQARPQARALLAADAHAFAGYARWQINDRWDAFAGEESLKPYFAEVKFFERMRAVAYDWPTALSLSLTFRLYLAKRDAFVRQAARDVFGLRRLLKRGEVKAFDLKLSQMLLAGAAFAQDCRKGLHAARAMGRRTRLATRGQNQMVVETDKSRLTAWMGWLRKLARQRDLVNGPNLMCGPWQLNLRVHNFAPAVQKVIVEQRNADGSWEELMGRYTIEFRAYAARAKTKLWRELSVPIANCDAVLRIRMGGVGQVQFSHATLTNGTMQKRLQPATKRKRLGRRAPAQGFPVLVAKDEKTSVWELPRV